MANGSFSRNFGDASFNIESSFSDTLTILGDSGSGIARFILTLTAFAGEDGSVGDTTGTFNFNAINSGSLIQTAFRFPTGPSVQTLIVDKLFTSGQPFSFGSTLVSQAHGEHLLRIESNFSLQIQLLNNNLDPSIGLAYISESGAAYPIIGASAVPEASNLVMALGGILLIVYNKMRGAVEI